MTVLYPLVYPNEIQLFQVNDYYYESNAFPSEGFNYFNTFLDAVDASYCTYKSQGITGDTPGIDPTYPDTNSDPNLNTAVPNPYYKKPHQCGAYKPPGVMSISYAWDEQEYPKNYTIRQCNEFAKLGELLATQLAISVLILHSVARHHHCRFFRRRWHHRSRR